ncbi:hypothetical protein niasHT_032764 [Heterodera trifolii]|uniref:Metalloendopeptidase n=1 Tax=Heterodera trifolii TaxID=157864 RepID=A0ABD2IYR4_9BILA
MKHPPLAFGQQRQCQIRPLFVCLLFLASRVDVVFNEMIRIAKINDGGDGKEQINFCEPHKMTVQQRQYIGKRLHMLLKINSTRHRHKIRAKRGTVGFDRKIWNRIPVIKNGKIFYMVPYTVLSPYDQKSAAVLVEVMMSIHKNTCIRFAKQQYYRNDDYIGIINDRGCHSVIGRHSGKNLLTLQVSTESPQSAQNETIAADGDDGGEAPAKKPPPRETCMKPRIVMHELLHILGLHHEHQRQDRSEYIDINIDNVRKGKEKNFREEMEQESWGLPFDYESIMNYRYDQFAKNRETKDQDEGMVIRVRNRDSFCKFTFGTHRHVSEMDFLMINMLYNCDGVHQMVDEFIRRNLRGSRRHHRTKKRQKLIKKMENQLKKRGLI